MVMQAQPLSLRCPHASRLDAARVVMAGLQLRDNLKKSGKPYRNGARMH